MNLFGFDVVNNLHEAETAKFRYFRIEFIVQLLLSSGSSAWTQNDSIDFQIVESENEKDERERIFVCFPDISTCRKPKNVPSPASASIAPPLVP